MKYDKALEIIINSYKEALKVENNLNNKAGFELTGISLLLSLIISVASLVYRDTCICCIDNAINNSYKNQLFLVFSMIISIMLIISLLLVLLSLIIVKRTSLPTETLIDDFKNYNNNDEELICTDTIEMYCSIAKSIDKLNEKRSKLLNVANFIIIISLGLILLFSFVLLVI